MLNKVNGAPHRGIKDTNEQLKDNGNLESYRYKRGNRRGKHLGIFIMEPQQDENGLGRVLACFFFVVSDPLFMKAWNTAGEDKGPSSLVLANKNIEWLRQLFHHTEMMKCSTGIG